MEENNTNAKFIEKTNSIYIKIVASFFIMMSHFTAKCPWYISIFFQGHLWVGVFFFYTGYGLEYSRKRKKDYFKGFLRKKVLLIYMPFLFAESAYTLLRHFCYHEEYGLTDLILCCGGAKLANSVLWYVIEVIIIYMLYYVFYSIMNISEDKKTFLWIATYIAFLAYAVFEDIGNWWYLSTVAFLFGIFHEKICHKINKLLLNNVISGWYALLFPILYFIIEIYMYKGYYVYFIPQNYFYTGVNMIMGPLFLIFIYIMAERIELKKTFLKRIPNVSYELYLWHMVAWLMTDLWCKNICLKIIISVFIAFVLAYVAYMVKVGIAKNISLNNS